MRDAAVDWVKFDAQLARDGSVDPVDKALYAALASFVDQAGREADPDGEDIPTRRKLAACIGRSVDTVDRATKRLEDYGLLDVERRQDPANPRKNLPSVYRLLDGERWDERAAERAERRRAEREARKAARKATASAPQPESPQPQGEEQEGEGWPHGCGQGGRTGAARVAARVRPGWPHGCGGSSSPQEPQKNPPLHSSTDGPVPDARRPEEEESPAAKNTPALPDVIIEATGATREEAAAMVEALAGEAKTSLSGYVRTLAANGDLAHRLRLLRRAAGAQRSRTAPRAEAAGCAEHDGMALPCGACRGDVMAGDTTTVARLLETYGPEVRWDLAGLLPSSLPTAAGGAR